MDVGCLRSLVACVIRVGFDLDGECVIGIVIGTALWTHLFDGKYLSYCPGLDTSISYLVEFIILHNQTQWDERQRHKEGKCQEAVHGLLVGAINSITRWRAGWV